MNLIIYLLFLLSGAASLIYQILWMRDLGLVFGNTTYATGTVLAAFMGGLGFGAYFLGKIYNNVKNPVKIYAILELIIGIYILVYPFLFNMCFPLYSYFYNNISSNFFLITLFRLFLSFAILFIPTFMMGGTLPI
ncbi:MAG TPA: spermidine synthase, partial [bacterium]|nr:spermidine synthase [bacterium]